MEHTLLKPRNLVIGRQGIPYSTVHHLLHGTSGGGIIHHDGNLYPPIGIDDELEDINGMEEDLGLLSKEQLDIRTAVDLCCLWRYDYPSRVREICGIIGGSKQTALRLHYQISPQKRQEFLDYCAALRGWLEEVSPDDESYFRQGSEKTTQKVYGFLGNRDPLKNKLVERTHIALAGRFLNCSFWGNNENEPKTNLLPYLGDMLDAGSFSQLSTLEDFIRKEMGRGAKDFLCDVGGGAEPACHFKFIRRVDILVSSIGCMEWRGNLPAKDSTVRGRRNTTAGFLQVLQKYWDGGVSSIGAESPELEGELFELLGEPNELKRWLVASLWKNIKKQTMSEAFPMVSWVEFVRTGESYLDTL
jgi:hypothetical protein